MKHLSITDRDQIQILLSKGYAHREIALVLGRPHSTINREITRNFVKGKYMAQKANHKVYVRRLFCKKQLKKIRSNGELEQFVRKKLKEGWSPEGVMGDWNNTHKELHISTPTICRYIYSRFGYGLTEYLYTKRIRPRKKNRKKREGIKYRTFIDFRPMIIGKKREFVIMNVISSWEESDLHIIYSC